MKPRSGAYRRKRSASPVGSPARGLTLDTGALIAFERADRTLIARLKEALVTGRRLTLPTAVLLESWRGGERSARLAPLIACCVIEPLLETVARDAGELLGRVRGSTPIDAVVVTSAAERGDFVLTSDLRDLSALASHVRGVDLVGV